MNKQLFKFFFAVIAFWSVSAQAQSKLGLQYINEERWWSAEKEFSKSTADEDVFYKGFCQMKLEDVEKAKVTFNSIATKPYGKIGLGMLEMNAGNLEGAKKLFETAADDTKNKNPQVFLAIANAISNSTANQKDEAAEWAKKAVDMQKNNSDFRIVSGDVYQNIQDGGNAIREFEYAQQYAPTSALPLAKLGQVYFRSRVYKLAKENLLKALEKDPKNILALNYLAQIYYKTQQYDTAKMYQAKVLEYGDKSPEDMAYMANIYFYEKDYNGAINIIAEIIKGDNKYNYLNRLIGYSYQETGKPTEAIEFLEKFLQTQPKEKIIASDYEYLGKAYMSAGDTNKGVETLKKSVELNPNDKEMIKNTADLMKKIKRYEDALAYYKKITELPEPSVGDFLNVGNMYFYYLRDYPSADAAYTKVLELSPNQVDVYYNKAKIKLIADPTQASASAKEDFLKYIEMTVGKEDKYKKKIVEAKLYMAKISITNDSDKVKAKQYIDEVLALDPENAEANSLIEHTK